MEVDNVVHVRLLNADRERIGGVEGERDQPPGAGRSLTALGAGKDTELHQAAFATVEQDGMLSAGLGTLHDADPFLVVAEQGEVQVWRAGVGLGRDRQLGEDPFPGLGLAAIFGRDDRLRKGKNNVRKKMCERLARDDDPVIAERKGEEKMT